MKKIILHLLFFGIILNLTTILPACRNDSAGRKQDEKSSMTVTELKQKIRDKEDIVILDVRLDEELTGPLGHIDGIVHIPLQELKQRLHELDGYKAKEIAVICRSGSRSNTATGFLRNNGFDAVNVEGGMIEYNRVK